jgi:hypothetical protein
MRDFRVALEDYLDYRALGDGSPLARAAASCCLDEEGGVLWVFGGFAGDFVASNELVAVDAVTLEVREIARLDVPARINQEMYFWNGLVILIGGSSFDFSSSMQLSREAIVYDTGTKSAKRFAAKGLCLRCASFFDADVGALYYTGGVHFSKSSMYRLDISTGENDEIALDPPFIPKTGSTSIWLPTKKAIVFSGFTKDGDIPTCHSDYSLIDPAGRSATTRRCNEFVGRTFSKAVLVERYKKALFLQGTWNGMEAARSVVYYDYERDRFDDLYLQPLPVDIIEGMAFYLRKENMVRVVGGMSGNAVQNTVWDLHLSRVEQAKLNG